MPDFAFPARLVPDHPGNRLRRRHHRVGDPVQQIDPAAPVARDPARVVAQRRRRIPVAELGADVGDRRAGGQEQAGECVAQVVEPERGELRSLERALERLPDPRLLLRVALVVREQSLGLAPAAPERLLLHPAEVALEGLDNSGVRSTFRSS